MFFDFPFFLRLRQIDQLWRSIRPSVIGQRYTTQISWRLPLFWGWGWMDGWSKSFLVNTGSAVELDRASTQPRMHRWGKNCYQQTDERHAQVRNQILFRVRCFLIIFVSVITRRGLWFQFPRSFPSKDSFLFLTVMTPFHIPLSLSSLRFDLTS